MTSERIRDYDKTSVVLKILGSGEYQTQLIKNSLNYLQKDTSQEIIYKPVSPNTPLLEGQNVDTVTGEEDLTKHTQMSISDIELALDYPTKKPELPTAQEIKGSLRGIAGHDISEMMNALIRNARKDGEPGDFTITYSNLKPYERSIIQETAASYISLYGNLRLIDLPYLAHDIWSGLKSKYVFYKRNGNSKKALLEGSVFKGEQISGWWNSRDQETFEDKIFSIYERRLKERMINPITDPDYLTLPLESDPNFELITEQLLVTHIHYGTFKIQMRGQADYVLSGKDKKNLTHLVIDNKYGKTNTQSEASRIQALLYSFMVSKRDYAKENFTHVSPESSMFLYHMFDTSSETPSSYYVDGTVYPDEYESVVKSLSTAVTLWWFYQKELKQIKNARKEAAFMPYLPKPSEEVVPVQRRLF